MYLLGPGNSTYCAGVPTPSAHVAQLVEHFLGKEEVTDSSSVMGYLVPKQTWLSHGLFDGQEILVRGADS